MRISGAKTIAMCRMGPLRTDRTGFAGLTLALTLLTVPALARPKRTTGPVRFVSPAVAEVQETVKKLQRLSKFTRPEVERVLGVRLRLVHPADPRLFEAEIPGGMFTRVQLFEFNPARPAAKQLVTLYVREERAPKQREFPPEEREDCSGNLVVVHGGPPVEVCRRTERGRAVSLEFRAEDSQLQEVTIRLPPRAK
jgi:hypothetical protein